MVNWTDPCVICSVVVAIVLVVVVIILLMTMFKGSNVVEGYAGDINQIAYDDVTPKLRVIPPNTNGAFPTVQPPDNIKLMTTDDNGNITVMAATPVLQNLYNHMYANMVRHDDIVGILNGTGAHYGLISKVNKISQSLALVQAYLWGNNRSPRDPYQYGDLEGKLLNILGNRTSESQGISTINGSAFTMYTGDGRFPVTINRDMLKKLTTDRFLIQSRMGAGAAAEPGTYMTLKRKAGSTDAFWDTESSNWNDVMYFFPSYKTDTSGPSLPPMSQRSQKNPNGFQGTPNASMGQDP
jgi:hypothetical protein